MGENMGVYPYILMKLASGEKFEERMRIPETKITEFANSIDPDEVAHHDPPHLDLCCLPSSLFSVCFSSD